MIRFLTHPKLLLVSRIFLAIVGSYVVATLMAIVPLAFGSGVSAVAWGYFVGVVAAVLVFVGVFLIYPLKRAWIFVAGLMGLLIAFCVQCVPNFLAVVGVV